MTGTASLEARRILVVEDQYYLATDICEWLKTAGAQIVGPASDADQACELLQTNDVDVAVVDINLGIGPTFEVAQDLLRRGVPFLFATGYDCKAIPKPFDQVPRIEKPFGKAKLVAAIEALLA